MNATPEEIEIRSAAGEVRVAWDDGHEGVYPMRYLRGYCPCAVCQGHSGRWDFVSMDAPMLVEVEEVGSYALRLVWDDGGAKHKTGLYTFETLRELCPCDSCLSELGDEHPVRRMP